MQNAYNAYVKKRTLHDNFFNQVVGLSKGYLESIDQLQESNQLT
jgi:hypothetical protein